MTGSQHEKYAYVRTTIMANSDMSMVPFPSLSNLAQTVVDSI
jgi:hypothetical protein